MKRISIIGIVGIPANYGGFETLVENIVDHNHSSDFVFTVYNSSRNYKIKLDEYKQAKMFYIPLKANGIQSIFYDIWALIHAAFHSDEMMILGVSGCCFLPILRLFYKKKIIINIDGLEHKRDKWSKCVRRFLLFSEKLAVKYANIIIADNKGIQDYVNQTYDHACELIAYGGDHVLCDVSKEFVDQVLVKYGLTRGEYSLSLCRIEPENNVRLILEAFANSGLKLVFIGNWKKNEYGIQMLSEYAKYENIKMLSPIYDLSILYSIRSNCLFYVHGHSAGGTNPSLVEAMFFAKPILAFDVVYNRETTENGASYFSTVEDLIALLNSSVDGYKENANRMKNIANKQYCWSTIYSQYERLFLR